MPLVGLLLSDGFLGCGQYFAFHGYLPIDKTGIAASKHCQLEKNSQKPNQPSYGKPLKTTNYFEEISVTLPGPYATFCIKYR